MPADSLLVLPLMVQAKRKNSQGNKPFQKEREMRSHNNEEIHAAIVQIIGDDWRKFSTKAKREREYELSSDGLKAWKASGTDHFVFVNFQR